MDLLRAALPPPDPDLAAAARRPFIADHAVQALAAGRARPAAAAGALATWFRQTRRLGSRDRRRVSALVHHVIRHEAFLARASGTTDPDDARLVAILADLLDGERYPTLSSVGPAADLAVALSVAEPRAAAWLDELGAPEAAAFATIQATRAPLYLRVHAARASRADVAASLAADGVQTEPIGAWGLTVQGRANVEATAAFRAGLVEMQDISSQRLVEALAEEGPGGRGLHGVTVLDLCAGAGGKSLALAACGARVTAWDTRRGALRQLRRRADRAGADIAVEAPHGLHDIVLVDAPCSGSGRLRREPTLRWWWRIEPDLLETLTATQAQLREQAADFVAPGGRLVYATCSVDRAEALAPTPPGFTELSRHRHWPQQGPGDGFSWQTWRRG